MSCRYKGLHRRPLVVGEWGDVLEPWSQPLRPERADPPRHCDHDPQRQLQSALRSHGLHLRLGDRRRKIRSYFSMRFELQIAVAPSATARCDSRPQGQPPGPPKNRKRTLARTTYGLSVAVWLCFGIAFGLDAAFGPEICKFHFRNREPGSRSTWAAAPAVRR